MSTVGNYTLIETTGTPITVIEDFPTIDDRLERSITGFILLTQVQLRGPGRAPLKEPKTNYIYINKFHIVKISKYE